MCVKDGNIKENEGINETAREYQVQMGAQASQTIQACVQNKTTKEQAKLDLVTQFCADPRGLEESVQNLENQLRSGREVQRIGVNLRNGRVLTIVYKDGNIDKYTITGGKAILEDAKKQALREEATGRKDQGNIGERIAAEYAVEHLGLFGIPFDPPQHGLDAVYENARGELVLAESKLAESGLGALGNPSYGKQGSPSWIAECARQMQTPGSGMYSETNAKIGERIEQIGVDRVHFVAISTDPQTFETTAYERQSDGSWQKIDK